MAGYSGSAFKMPELRTKAELLQRMPELARLFSDDDHPDGGQRPAAPAPRGGAVAARGLRSPSTPHKTTLFGDAGPTEEEALHAELAKVKKDRASLLCALARLRDGGGKSGGELQCKDTALLRRELETKKEFLNELRTASRDAAQLVAHLELQSAECERLMPGGLEGAQAAAATLLRALGAADAELGAANARSVMYSRLEERTRRDRQTAELAWRSSAALASDAAHDVRVLARAVHESRAAKEDAERALGATMQLCDQERLDWGAKLRDRRKQLREMERHRGQDAAHQQRMQAARKERDRRERERAAAAELSQAAGAARAAEAAADADATDTTWGRLRALTGAAAPEDVAGFWEGLRQRASTMRDLITLADGRERRARAELARLAAERARALEVGNGAHPGPRTPGASAGTESSAAAELNVSKASSEQEPWMEGSLPEDPEGAPPATADSEEHSAGGDDSSASVDMPMVAPTNELSAAPALQPPAEAIVEVPEEVAPQAPAAEAPAPTEAPAAAIDAAAVPAWVEDVAAQDAYARRAAGIADARRRTERALAALRQHTQICVAADQGLRLLLDRLHASAALPSGARGARRPLHSGKARAPRRSSLHSGLPPRRVSAVAFQEQARRACQQAGSTPEEGSTPAALGQTAKRHSLLAPPARIPGIAEGSVEVLAKEPAAAAAAAVVDPQGAMGSPFFPNLPLLAEEVSSWLERLASHVSKLEAASKGRPSDAHGQPGQPEGEPAAGEQADQGKAGGDQGAAEATGGAAQAVPAGGKPESSADGERAVPGGRRAPATLARGYRRPTWAGPEWWATPDSGAALAGAVAARLEAPAGGASAAAALRRLVGYVATDGVEREDTYNEAWGSSDEEGILDRDFIKRRAEKLTAPKPPRRNKRAGAMGSPARAKMAAAV